MQEVQSIYKMCKKVYVQKSIQQHGYILFTCTIPHVPCILFTCTIHKTHTRHNHTGSVIKFQLFTSTLFLPTSQLELDGKHTSIFNLTFIDQGGTAGFVNCSWTKLTVGDLGTVTLSQLSYYESRILWEMSMAPLEGRRRSWCLWREFTRISSLNDC